MRLFVGLDIPDGITTRLNDSIEAFRRTAPKLQWTPIENLHITTQFIGEWTAERLDDLKTALAGVRAEEFEIRLNGFGWFPNPHSPRIFWACARGGAALANLAAVTSAATAQVGVPKEDKAYTPHVTLARVNPGVDLRELRGAVANLPDPDWGSFRARQFFLYRSEKKPAGSEYTKLAGFPLLP